MDRGTASERARWLAELAEAVDQAQRVAWALGSQGSNDGEALDLYCRLESVRVELESLRHERFRPRTTQIDPFRINHPPPGASRSRS